MVPYPTNNGIAAAAAARYGGELPPFWLAFAFPSRRSAQRQLADWCARGLAKDASGEAEVQPALFAEVRRG